MDTTPNGKNCTLSDGSWKGLWQANQAAPVLASYSPTAPPYWFDTKRLLPDNTSCVGTISPVMKLELIAAPVVALYPAALPVP